MKLSVCLIVKNEEDVLARCLGCVQKFADEIIVVDTGSADATKQIASRFTDKVYDFKWQSDFALARNFSFSKASGDFIMWLDADDVIDKANIEKIVALKTRPFHADVYFFKYAMFNPAGKKTLEFYRERIVRKSMGLKWQGFIHEAIAPAGKIEKHDIVIFHKKEKAGNPKRNLKIYLHHKRLGTPFDARSTYYFAKEYYYNGYFKSAIKTLKKFLKMDGRFAPNEADAYLTLARCYAQMGKYSSTLKVLQDALLKTEFSGEMACEMASAFYHINQPTKAVLFYEMALKISPNFSSGAFVDEAYYNIIPMLELVKIYYQLGEVQKSKKMHNLCMEKYPSDARVIYNENFYKAT